MGPHMENRIGKHKLDLNELKAAIESPDIRYDDKDDDAGVVLRKNFGNYSIVVCVNYGGDHLFLKTAWKQLHSSGSK